MKLATPRSPKFRRLMNLTGLSRAAVAGTLELLWLFAMEQAPAGDVGRWSDEDLEAELDWMGDPGKLVEALVETRWLDRCAVHRLIVHDWQEHLPEFLAKRVERGSLTLATVSTCPDTGENCLPTADNGGQRPPAADNVGHRAEMSANGGIREEKRSQAKPREAKPSGETAAAEPPPPAQTSKRLRATRVPDQLSAEDRARVQAWAARQAPPITVPELEYGWRTYLSRARAKGYKYEDHARAFMNALSAPDDRWALNGYAPPGGNAGRYRDADEVMAESRRKMAEDDAKRRAEREEADRIGNVIDLGLRQAGGASA